jgi:hypothetical protein
MGEGTGVRVDGREVGWEPSKIIPGNVPGIKGVRAVEWPGQA